MAKPTSVAHGCVECCVKLIVNNEPREAPDGITVEALIELIGLAGAPCAAEVNKELVPKRRHAERVLREGDRVELVTLVGGG